MSSRSRGKRHQGTGYPTQWSDWVFSDEYQRRYRYRLRGPDDYEYDYEQSTTTPTITEEPFLEAALETYPQQHPYTMRTPEVSEITKTSEADSLTQTFAEASISPSGASYGLRTEPYASGIPSYGQPQASSDQYPSTFPSAGSYPSIEQYTTGSSSNPVSDLSVTPSSSAQSYSAQTSYASPSSVWQNHIRTRDPYTDREEFDPCYKVHGSWAFKWGKVFKVLWAEPKGTDDGGSEYSGSSITIRKTPTGKETFAKVRRFVIIKPMQGHCICLPILTYSGQGINKRGVVADYHAIIYSGKKPVAFRGEKEKGLQMRSIKVIPDNPRHRLDDASRLNYAKTYTVEYNVKVWFIGKVSSDSEWQIRNDYNRIHPPLEIKEPRPPDNPDGTYAHGRSTYENYTTATSSAPYLPPAYGATDYSHPIDGELGSKQTKNPQDIQAVEGEYHTLDRLKIWDQHGDFEPIGESERSSSPESVGSSKLSRGSSTTSLSLGGQPVIHEHLVNVVLQDDELRALCDQAIHNSTWGSFEKNLRQCLVQLSKDIRLEIQSRQATQAARAIRTFARSAAQSIKGTLELQELAKETGQGLYHLSAQMDLNSDGSDVEEMDPIDEVEEDHMAEFKYFKDLVVSSRSFERFKERFDLCVNPDQARSAVFQQWGSVSSTSSRESLSYDIELDLHSFIDIHVKDPAHIGELLTLTGEAEDAEALSCREYLSRSCPEIGMLLLEGIQVLLIHKSNLCIQNKAAKLEFILTEGSTRQDFQLSLKANAVYTTHTQIATAISWMCASFQSSSHTEIMMSSASVVAPEATATDRTAITIRPNMLSKPSAESCWHSLFPNRVIARGYPVRPRHEGRGLKITFENMVTASRCLTFVEYEKGLIAHGLISVLIPMKILEKDNAIQWHLEDKRNQKLCKLARISQVLSNSPALRYRLKELQPEKLIGRQCFLGLAEHANVVIGTKDYQRTFAWSGSPKAPAEAYVNSHSLSMGSGLMGSITGNGTYTRTLESIRTTILSPQDKDIFDILDSGKEHLALIFDTTKNIGWYLPQISVALQMTHAIISMHGYQVHDGSSGVPETSEVSALCFASAGPNAAVEASNAVKRSLRLKIRKYDSEGSPPVDTDFGDMFTKAWHTLSNAETGLESAQCDFRKTRQVAPKFIHGVEFLDAANMEPSIRIKVVRVDQAWAHLTSEQPLVILSKDIQPPIVPESSTLCKFWRLGPPQCPHQSYLMSMGLAISSFLDRRNEGLADGLDWKCRTKLIESHEPGDSAPVNHTQILVSRKNPRSNSPIRKMMLKYQRGCFVFGADNKKPCIESIDYQNPSSNPSTINAPSLADNTSMPNSSMSMNTSSQLSQEGIEKDLQIGAAPNILIASATIRLNINARESESPLYVINGSTHFTDLSSRSLIGKGLALTKRTPRFMSAMQKLLPKKQENEQSSKAMDQADPRTLGNGSADISEYEDLYDA